jgi:hypothetical protein
MVLPFWCVWSQIHFHASLKQIQIAVRLASGNSAEAVIELRFDVGIRIPIEPPYGHAQKTTANPAVVHIHERTAGLQFPMLPNRPFPSSNRAPGSLGQTNGLSGCRAGVAP